MVVEFVKRQLLKNDGRKALLIAYFYLIGLVLHAVPITRPYMLIVTPYFLAVVGILVFLPLVRSRNWPVIIWCAGTYAVTFALEVVGVQTGIIFGSYNYGNVLGLQLGGVPLVIGFNWVLIILGGVIFSRRFVHNPLLSALIVGAIAFIVDFVLEPIAIGLGYWQWEDGTVPIRNYLSWFGIAFLSALIYNLAKLKTETKLPMYYVAVQAGFFIALRFFITL